jgi:hypothetical protein
MVTTVSAPPHPSTLSEILKMVFAFLLLLILHIRGGDQEQPISVLISNVAEPEPKGAA